MATEIEKWIQEIYSPIVVTCATPETERLCRKNGLSFSQLLNGFSILENADAPIRTVSHQFTLQHFRMQFHTGSDFNPIPAQPFSDKLHQLLRNSYHASEEYEMPVIQSLESAFAVRDSMSRDPLQWFTEFKTKFLQMLRCDETSMLYCPVALVLAVSSSDANPLQSLQNLTKTENLPPGFRKGLYDPDIPKYCLVIHDVQQSQGVNPEMVLQHIRPSFSQSSILRVNSLPEHQPDLKAYDLWTNHPHVRQDINFNSSPNDKPLGCLLSSEDLNEIRSFVWELGLRIVIPALETRIFSLNETVSSTRKGMKNVLKSWWRKPKETLRNTTGNMVPGSSQSKTTDSGAVLYRFDQIEGQIRLLADTAFLVRDYDLALSMYRLVKDDYKSDKALLHFGSCNEMIAFCLLFTGNHQFSSLYDAVDSSLSAYGKVNTPTAVQMASRATIVGSEIYRTLANSGSDFPTSRSRESSSASLSPYSVVSVLASSSSMISDILSMDNTSNSMEYASNVLVRGSELEKDPLCIAVLTERAAICDLQCVYPKYRKFGLRLALSGYAYLESGQLDHAIRCLNQSRSVYENSEWHRILDHLNFKLACQVGRSDLPSSSLSYFLDLIGSGRRPKPQQELYLREFQTVLLDSLSQLNQQKPFFIDEFCLPAFKDNSVRVYNLKNAGNAEWFRYDDDDDLYSLACSSSINEELDEGAYELLKDELEMELLIQEQIELKQRKSAKIVAMESIYSISQSVRRNQKKHRQMYKRNPRALGNSDLRCYAQGENIYIDFIVKNVLDCDLAIEKVHLFGKFESQVSGESIDLCDAQRDVRMAEIVEIQSIRIKLAGTTAKRVTIRLCPKQEGTLSITGVRWCMFEGLVSSQHAFSIPGKLLHRTREERALRVRSPANEVLKMRIRKPQAWLSVTSQHREISLLYGEMVDIELELANVGPQNLTGLYLYSNVVCSTQERSAVLLREDPSDSNGAGIEAIGATGSTYALDNRVKLGPHGKASLPLRIHALGEGRQKLQLFFRYDGNPDSSGSQERNPFRYLLFTIQVDITAVLSVQCDMSPNYSSESEHTLALHLSNKMPKTSGDQDGTSKCIEITQVSIVSSEYRIESYPLVTPNGTSESCSTLVRPSEEVSLYSRVIPLDDRSGGNHGSETTWLSSLPLSDSKSESESQSQVSSPCIPILCLDNARNLYEQSMRFAQEEERERNRANPGGTGLRTIQSIRRDKQSKQNESPQYSSTAVSSENGNIISSLCSPSALILYHQSKVHVIVSWKVSDSSNEGNDAVFGQHHLLGIEMSASLLYPPCPLPLQPHQYKCPLSISLEYPPVCKLKRLNVQPVQYHGTLDVRLFVYGNIPSDSHPINVVMNLFNTHRIPALSDTQDEDALCSHGSGIITRGIAVVDSARTFNRRLDCTSPFQYAGVSRRKVENLRSGETACFNLTACFKQPGVYDLNRFEFSVQNGKETSDCQEITTPAASVFVFPAQYLVSVVDG